MQEKLTMAATAGDIRQAILTNLADLGTSPGIREDALDRIMLVVDDYADSKPRQSTPRTAASGRGRSTMTTGPRSARKNGKAV